MCGLIGLLVIRCARVIGLLFLMLVIAQMFGGELRAQMPDDYQPKITGVPPVVQREAKSLWLRASMYLESGSPTFYAVVCAFSEVAEDSHTKLGGEFAGTLTTYEDSLVVVLDEIKIHNTAAPTW
jgi:hypothetical protein